jgi:phosphoglycolate phosphatase
MTRAALFDLDGTLVESGPAIIANIRHAMAAVGHPLDPAEDLTWVVGPPLADIFARLLNPVGGARAAEAAAIYRRTYDSVGMFESVVYPGIGEMLAGFRDAGWTMLVATSKPHAVARRLLQHFDLAGNFVAIHGAGPDGALAHKPELIAHVLSTHGLAAAGTVMIGDRSFDIFGAHANGLRAVGVLWGYGDREELEQAGADGLAGAPEELLAVAGGLLHAGPHG